MRLQYPPEIKIILMPCTGRVDILHLLKAFEAGADAVFVAGCLEGECHYLRGNIQAKKRVNKVKQDFAQMGFEPRTPGDVQPLFFGGAEIRGHRQGNGGAGLETGPQPHEPPGPGGLAEGQGGVKN